MAEHGRTEDPWRIPHGSVASASAQVVSDTAGKPDASRPVALREITGVAPLDHGLGSAGAKAVPDALAPVLLDPTELDRTTFALLDAARITNLPELLETSGLPYKCLFVGEAQGDLGHVAPWLVELDEESAFTRNLFSSGPAPWHLWDVGGAVLLRTRASFERVFSHLRRRLKVQDETGNLVFFRSWDPVQLMTLLTTKAATAEDLAWLLCDADGVVLEHVICRDGTRCLSARATSKPAPSPHRLCVTQELRAAFHSAVAARAAEQDIAAVRQVLSEADVDLVRAERATLLSLRFRNPDPMRAALCYIAHRGVGLDGLAPVEREILSAHRQSDFARIRLLRRAVGPWPHPAEMAGDRKR